MQTNKFIRKCHIKLKHWCINILLCLLSFTMSIGVAELLVRYFSNNPSRIIFKTKADVVDGQIHTILSKDPIQVFELKPSQSVCVKQHCETINKHGFRGTEFDFSNTTSVRIALVGDSFTYGYGVDDDEVMSVHLERLLNNIGQKKVVVLNFGIGGYNSAQIARQLQNKIIAFEPHIVIYNYFPNDVELYWQEGNPVLYECAPMFSWKQPVIKTLISSHLLEFFSRRIGLRHMARHGQDEKYWTLIHHTLWPGWWVVKQAFKEMKRITYEADIFFCVSLLPHNDLPFEEKNKTLGKIDALCKMLNIPVINNSECFINISPYDKFWTTVGPPHYSNLGNQVVAENIAKQLIEWSVIAEAL